MCNERRLRRLKASECAVQLHVIHSSWESQADRVCRNRSILLG